MNSLTLDIKKSLASAAESELQSQIKEVRNQLLALQEAEAVEIKSSAGDKYETHREVIGQSRDILDQQLARLKAMAEELKSLMILPHQKISEGTLFQVPMGFIWASVPIGKIHLEGRDFQLVSANAPLFQALKGLKKGETAQFRGQSIKVMDLI